MVVPSQVKSLPESAMVALQSRSSMHFTLVSGENSILGGTAGAGAPGAEALSRARGRV